MRFKQPYSVVRRLTVRGTAIFVYRVYDPATNKRREYSTGKTSRAAAKQFCESLVKLNQLLPEATQAVAKTGLFGEFAKDWWGPQCPYCASQAARGHALSRSYRALNLIRLNKQILPAFGSTPLREITSRQIETWFMGLEVNPRVKNTALQVLRVMLGEAERLQLIDSNPAKRVRPVAEPRKVRDLYTPEEVRALFDAESVATVWARDEKSWLGCLLVANSAMRAGEILGLQTGGLHKEVGTSWVAVDNSWDRKELKGTKSGVNRKIPVPDWLIDRLQAQVVGTGFVFSDDWGKTPITYFRLRKSLKSAMVAIGIGLAAQKTRGLGLHGIRHWVNTNLRGKVSDDIIQTMVGHTSKEMTDLYTSRPLADFVPVMDVIQGVFNGGNDEVEQ